MATPVSYKEFVKNPIVGLLFLAVVGLGYMQMENTKLYKKTIDDCRSEVEAYRNEVKILKEEVRILQDKIFELAGPK